MITAGTCPSRKAAPARRSLGEDRRGLQLREVSDQAEQVGDGGVPGGAGALVDVGRPHGGDDVSEFLGPDEGFGIMIGLRDERLIASSRSATDLQRLGCTLVLIRWTSAAGSIVMAVSHRRAKTAQRRSSSAKRWADHDGNARASTCGSPTGAGTGIGSTLTLV